MQTIDRQIRECEARLKELQKKLDKEAHDVYYAAHPEVWEADSNEYLFLFEELQALFERKSMLLEERENDPAYDGSSPSLTKKEEVAFYREHAIRNQADILSALEKIKAYYRAWAKEEKLPLEQILRLLDGFAGEIEGLRLMNITQDWWQYEISVRETEVTLSLAATEIGYDFGRTWEEKNRPFLLPLQAYPLFSLRAKLLSPEEFGALYEVPKSTVLRWLREGKLRSASRFGKEWRIPELTVVRPGERIVNGSYSWKTNLPDVPEEFAWLKDFSALSFSPARGEKNAWHASLTGKTEEKKRQISLDGKTKKELELYLIGEPLVECENNYLGDFFDKTLQEWDEVTGEG